MYDCEGVVTNDPKINEIYYKFVQEQMVRALDNATEYLTIIDNLKAGKPLLSNQIETLKDCFTAVCAGSSSCTLHLHITPPIPDRPDGSHSPREPRRSSP